MHRETKRKTGRGIDDRPRSRGPKLTCFLSVVLLVTTMGCSSAKQARAMPEFPTSELWISLSKGHDLFDTTLFFNSDGIECFSSAASKPDRFAARNDRDEKLASEFLERWKGSSQGDDRYVSLLVAPTGDRSLGTRFGNVHGLIRELPDRLAALPVLEGATLKLPSAWHPDGKLLAVGAAHGRNSHGIAQEVIIIDVTTREILNRIKPAGGRSISDIAWNPEGNTMAVLTKISRKGSGIIAWLGRTIGHGAPDKDYVLELHSFEGNPTIEIPVVEDVTQGTGRVVWETSDPTVK